VAASVGSLIVNVRADTAQFRTGLKGARAQVSSFTSGIRSAVKRVMSFGAALTGIGGAGLGIMIRSTLQSIDATAKLSQQLGVTTEKLQGLRHAAELTGAGADTLDAGLKTMAKRLGEAARGAGAAKPALEELGLSAAELVAMSPAEAFYRIAEALGTIEEPARKNAIAANIFSKANMGLVNTLALGAKGLREAQREAERLGKTYSNVSAKDVEAANDAITRLKAAFSGFTTQLTVAAAPAIQKIADTIAGAIDIIKNLDAKTKKNIASIAKWTAGIVAAIVVIPKVIGAIKAVISAVRTLTKAQIIMQAFSGPKGWVALAAGAAVAAGAVYGVSKAWESVEEGIKSAQAAGRRARQEAKAAQGKTTQPTGPPAGAPRMTSESLRIERERERIEEDQRKALEAINRKFDALPEAIGREVRSREPPADIYDI